MNTNGDMVFQLADQLGNRLWAECSLAEATASDASRTAFAAALTDAVERVFPLLPGVKGTISPEALEAPALLLWSELMDMLGRGPVTRKAALKRSLKYLLDRLQSEPQFVLGESPGRNESSDVPKESPEPVPETSADSKLPEPAASERASETETPQTASKPPDLSPVEMKVDPEEAEQVTSEPSQEPLHEKPRDSDLMGARLEDRVDALERELALSRDLGFDVLRAFLSTYLGDEDTALRTAVEEGWNRRAGSFARAMNLLVDLFDQLSNIRAELLKSAGIKTPLHKFKDMMTAHDADFEEQLASSVEQLKALVPAVLEVHQFSTTQGLENMLSALESEGSGKNVSWMPANMKPNYKNVLKLLHSWSGIDRYKKVIEPYFIEGLKIQSSKKE